VIFANLLAIPLFFMVVPFVVRLSAVKLDAVAPIAIVLSLTAALINAPRLATVFQVFIATLLGVGLKRANWPRAPFVLGFVVAQMAESAYFQTAAIWGWRALARPQMIILVAALVGWMAYSLRRRSPLTIGAPKGITLKICGILAVFFCVVLAWSL